MTYRALSAHSGSTIPPDQEVSRRIEVLRYLLIAGIVVLHTPPYVTLGELPADAGFFASFKAFFQSALFRLTVPTLSAISGYLLFRHRTEPYGLLVRKKARTILVPMVIWNTAAFAALYLLALVSGPPSVSADAPTPLPFDFWTALDGIMGFTGTNHWNYPLNFLRDLYVLILLAPVMGLLLRRAPYLGLIVWTSIFFFNLDGPLVGRAAMPITFYLGGLAATRRWDLLHFDRYRLVLLAGLLLACWIVVDFRLVDQRMFRTLMPLLIWPAASLLTKTRIGGFMAHHAHKSFFIFLSHAFVLKAYAILAEIAFPSHPEWLTWVCLPVATIFTCHLAYDAAQSLMPRTFRVLTGGRSFSHPGTNRRAYS